MGVSGFDRLPGFPPLLPICVYNEMPHEPGRPQAEFRSRVISAPTRSPLLDPGPVSRLHQPLEVQFGKVCASRKRVKADESLRAHSMTEQVAPPLGRAELTSYRQLFSRHSPRVCKEFDVGVVVPLCFPARS